MSLPNGVKDTNENITAGAHIMAGDGGYSIGTKEEYDEFVKLREANMVDKSIREEILKKIR